MVHLTGGEMGVSVLPSECSLNCAALSSLSDLHLLHWNENLEHDGQCLDKLTQYRGIRCLRLLLSPGLGNLCSLKALVCLSV